MWGGNNAWWLFAVIALLCPQPTLQGHKRAKRATYVENVFTGKTSVYARDKNANKKDPIQNAMNSTPTPVWQRTGVTTLPEDVNRKNDERNEKASTEPRDCDSSPMSSTPSPCQFTDLPKSSSASCRSHRRRSNASPITPTSPVKHEGSGATKADSTEKPCDVTRSQKDAKAKRIRPGLTVTPEDHLYMQKKEESEICETAPRANSELVRQAKAQFPKLRVPTRMAQADRKKQIEDAIMPKLSEAQQETVRKGEAGVVHLLPTGSPSSSLLADKDNWHLVTLETGETMPVYVQRKPKRYRSDRKSLPADESFSERETWMKESA